MNKKITSLVLVAVTSASMLMGCTDVKNVENVEISSTQEEKVEISNHRIAELVTFELNKKFNQDGLFFEVREGNNGTVRICSLFDYDLDDEIAKLIATKGVEATQTEWANTCNEALKFGKEIVEIKVQALGYLERDFNNAENTGDIEFCLVDTLHPSYEEERAFSFILDRKGEHNRCKGAFNRYVGCIK